MFFNDIFYEKHYQKFISLRFLDEKSFFQLEKYIFSVGKIKFRIRVPLVWEK